MPAEIRDWLLTSVGTLAGFLLGMAGGVLLTLHLTRPTATGPLREIRLEAPGRFTNPLLECDVAEEYLQQPELRNFRNTIDEVVAARVDRGEIVTCSVYFRDLNNGPWFGVNERDQYHPASLMKMPLMMAILKRAETDPSLLQTSLPNDLSTDYNEMIHFKPPDIMAPGRKYTIEELLSRMIRFSDNNALQLLLGYFGDAGYQALLQELGLPQDPEGSTLISVKSYSAFLRVLYNASYLSRAMSEKALEMLAGSSFDRGILGGVPLDIPVASKYGEAVQNEDGVPVYQLHEFAIVYHPRHPYLLGVMSRGADIEALPRLIQEISRVVYREVDAQS